ncbi:MAG: SUMF1/EgtB/PvdO family nonheme iron enzyme [Planctomycetia bacterium]|nr:SUMF1/EgtB/PvdO family nonheme iron enzyme [Planctomycetia bacterium]
MSNSIDMKLVLIPAGEFMMGSGASAETLAALFDEPPSAFSAEYPRHQVRISKAFYAGKYEVTVEQYRQFVEATGYQTYNEVHPEGGIVYDRKQKKPIRVKGVSWRNPDFEQTDAHPVVSVTWDDAVAFCDWLSAKEGARYRLPTEAEREYVSRAATDTIYNSGNRIEDLEGCCNAAGLEVPPLLSDGVPLVSRVPWNDGFSYTSPVGSFRPNGFGLYDITGNVWEWCSDSLREYLPKSISVDPIGPVSGETRAVRGGSHADGAFNQRVARRAAPPRELGNLNFGFRVVRELDIKP